MKREQRSIKIVFGDKPRVQKLTLPVDAVVQGVTYRHEPGRRTHWLDVIFESPGPDSPTATRGFKACREWEFPVRDQYRDYGTYAAGTIGFYHLIEVMPRLEPVTKRELSREEIQVTPLQLGMNVLQLPRIAAVNPKCPIRTISRVPHLCWRGDTRRGSRGEVAPYLVVVASRRSRDDIEHTHVQSAKAVEAKGLVVQVNTNTGEYSLWIDTKLVGG